MKIIEYITQSTFGLLALGLLWYWAGQLRSIIAGAPYVASPSQDVETMVKLAHLKPTMAVYDLGSGDGRLLFAAAKHAGIAKGVEVNAYLVFLTLCKLWWRKIPNATVIHRSLWKVPLHEADVVFVYLLPAMLPKLEHKFDRELKTGAVIICKDFPLPHWKPDIRQDHIFRYVKK